MARKDRKSPETPSPTTTGHMWDHVYAGPSSPTTTAPFPALLGPPKMTQDATSSSPSAFRRLARMPSWVRGNKRSAPRSPSLSPSPTTSKHFSVSTKDTVSSTTSPSRIPSSPTHPPQPPPVPPRLTCRSLGVSARMALPNATTTQGTSDASIDPSVLQEQRRRSLSSPQILTSQTQKPPTSGGLVPRSAVITHSWGELDTDASDQGKEEGGNVITIQVPPAPKSDSIPNPPESPTTMAYRQLGTILQGSTSWELLNGEDSCSSSILPTKLTQFESVTQLNLKLGAGEELTVEELMLGMKQAFSRYYGVLDTIAELKKHYEGENEGLRAKVKVMEEQKRQDDAELNRLRALLADTRDSRDRRPRPYTANAKTNIPTSTSWQTDSRPPKASNALARSSSTRATSRPSLTLTLDPGPPPAGPLPPLPPLPVNRGVVIVTSAPPAFKFEGRRRRVTVPAPSPTAT